MYVCMNMYVYMYVCICIYIYMYVYIYIYVYGCIYVHISETQYVYRAVPKMSIGIHIFLPYTLNCL